MGLRLKGSHRDQPATNWPGAKDHSALLEKVQSLDRFESNGTNGCSASFLSANQPCLPSTKLKSVQLQPKRDYPAVSVLLGQGIMFRDQVDMHGSDICHYFDDVP